MRASPNTQAAVEATLSQWADAYSKRDLDRALALIAPDDDVVGIGTGQDEWRVGTEEFKAQLERDFSQAEVLSVDYEPVVVSGAGSVAWAAGRAPRAGPRGRSGPHLGRSFHCRPGGPGRPLASLADALLAASSRAGRGPILLSSAPASVAWRAAGGRRPSADGQASTPDIAVGANTETTGGPSRVVAGQGAAGDVRAVMGRRARAAPS